MLEHAELENQDSKHMLNEPRGSSALFLDSFMFSGPKGPGGALLRAGGRVAATENGPSILSKII